ncbi:MAG TPA: IclR family transcriptional regulator [Microbacterium sp.]|jgi:DNA-binding IclR family transcriptional regulator|nr:IclR family transcriptional regulator [Microbacterium sp.]
MTTSQVDASPSKPMTAAQRALAILGCFDQDHLLLTLSEISRRSHLSLSTTHRLVGELREWGALERSSDSRYAIGVRILELGSLEPQGMRLRDVALPFLGDLHAATNANVHLAVRDGHDVVYVDSLHARGGAPVLSRLGGRWPLHTTGTGLVLLAFGPAELREKVLAAPLKSFTPRTITDPEHLRRVLADVRRTGVGIVEDSITVGCTSVGVPVRGQRDRIVGAIAVTVPVSEASPMAVLPALTTAARAISRGLGAPSAMGRPT